MAKAKKRGELRVQGHKARLRTRWVKCGRPNCPSCPHGPYVYLCWHDGTRARERYLGKQA